MDDTPQFAQMQTLLFPFLASLIFVFIHIVIYFLLVRKIHSKKSLTYLYSAILWGNMVLSILYMFMRSYAVAPKWIFMLASISVGVAFSFFVAALCVAYFNAFLWLLQKRYLQLKTKRYILALCFLYSGYAVYHGLQDPKVKHLSIELPKLIAPLKVLQLSDVHIGGLIDEDRVAKIVFLSNQEKPDIIVITGDLVDTSLENAKASLELLGGLQATYGVYYVLGNHEYIHNIYEILDKIYSLGIKVLINQNEEIENVINIAGSADLMGKRMKFLEPDFSATFAGINPSLPTICLTHQPKVVDILDSDMLQKADFWITGHTHGGQFFPISLGVLLQQPYLKGLHKIRHTDVYIYVSEGAGFWGPPMRTFSDSEITLFEFLPKQKQGSKNI